MQFFYDGQVRRYITQVVRVFSNFVVKYGDGTLHRIPVMYGDPDRQVASIIRQNSENVVNSVPRIAVYIRALSLDRNRIGDATFVDKVQIVNTTSIGYQNVLMIYCTEIYPLMGITSYELRIRINACNN